MKVPDMENLKSCIMKYGKTEGKSLVEVYILCINYKDIISFLHF